MHTIFRIFERNFHRDRWWKTVQENKKKKGNTKKHTVVPARNIILHKIYILENFINILLRFKAFRIFQER